MNEQLVFGIIAVVPATTLIASLVVDYADTNYQSIGLSNKTNQSSQITTSGKGSADIDLGINTAKQQHKQQ